MPDLKDFSLLAAVLGRGYPTKELRIFLDAKSGFELSEVNDQLKELARDPKFVEDLDATGKRKYNALEKRAKALAKAVSDSSITFHLEGIPSDKVDELRQASIDKFQVAEDADDDARSKAGNEANMDFQCALIAAHIRGGSQGDQKDDSTFTTEQVLAMSKAMPQSEWLNLVGAVNTLSFESAYFDESVDAGFLSRF